MGQPPTLLLVEDEMLVVQFITQALRTMGFVVQASLVAGEDVLAHVGKHRPDLILMDINLAGDMSGIDAALSLRKDYDIPLIFITGYSENEVQEAVRLIKPAAFLFKPILLKDLRRAVLSVLGDPCGSEARILPSGLAFPSRLGEGR